METKDLHLIEALTFTIDPESKVPISEFCGKVVRADKMHPQTKYILPDSLWEGELIQTDNDLFKFIPHKEIKSKTTKHYWIGQYHMKRLKEVGCSFYFDPTWLPEFFDFTIVHDEKFGMARYRIDIDMEKNNLKREDWLSYIKEVLMQNLIPIRAQEISTILDELEKISKGLEELRADEAQRRKDILERLSVKRDYKENAERGQTVLNDNPATFEEYLCSTFVNFGIENVDFDKDISNLRFIVFGNGKCLLTTDDDSFQATQFFTSR